MIVLPLFRYEYPQYLVLKDDEVCGIVNNEIEFLHTLVFIKKHSLEGYSLKDIKTGNVFPILSNGRIRQIDGIDMPYDESDKLLKLLMEF